VSVDSSEASGADGADEYLDVSLEETSDGYEVDVAQEMTVDATSADQWSTEEQAEQTLWREYGVYAALLAAQARSTSRTTISRSDRTANTGSISNSPSSTGVDGGIEEQLTDQLASDPTMDLSRSEAQAIATSVTDTDIETLSFTMDASGSSMDVEWDVAIENYNELTVAMLFDLAEATATDDQLPEDQLENARTAIEAQQAADLGDETHLGRGNRANVVRRDDARRLTDERYRKLGRLHRRTPSLEASTVRTTFRPVGRNRR